MPKLTRYDIRKLLYETLLLTESPFDKTIDDILSAGIMLKNGTADLSAADQATAEGAFDKGKSLKDIIPTDVKNYNGTTAPIPALLTHLYKEEDQNGGFTYFWHGVYFNDSSNSDMNFSLSEEAYNAILAAAKASANSASAKKSTGNPAKNWDEYIKATKGGDKIKELWEKGWKKAGGQSDSYKGYTSWYKTIKQQNGNKHLSPDEIIAKLKSNDGQTLLSKIATGVANVSQAVADNSTDRQARRKERRAKFLGRGSN